MLVKKKGLVKRKYNTTAREFLEYVRDNPHENLPAIAEVTEDFYVMEYIEGKTLDKVVEEKTFSYDEAKKLILQLIDAVAVLHKFKIVHRDIKPENIVITDEGVLKLIDFDIARKIVNTKNRDTMILGTAGYAAPEQFGFMQTDEQTDIYAIGILYNFLLTGSFPSEKKPSGEVGKIIDKCTKIDKRNRYKNIKILKKDVSIQKFTAYGFFDIIPGFRTGNVIKMLFASSVYLIVFMGFIFLGITEAPIENPSELVGFLLALFVYIVCDFAFFAIATNFLNIIEKIKIPIKKVWLKKAVLLGVIYFSATAISIAVHDNPADVFLGNPINATVGIYLYMFYCIIEPLIIGML